ncbi:hypothetical protein RSOLAG1IB_01969 [Rhizoctonia solani AG-1 IB]|uniref:Uncharacterized protein n=1 Tax=Thanatephorus cucumeris (strain AG1-IB / isolate 7/3/14) TaxID=1108050 RepID=A0A0B7FD22_THACB|nr:hypothetical protein RSOLAG1IB_01969 [Rhizoctonia solani AG-1 IB]
MDDIEIWPSVTSKLEKMPKTKMKVSRCEGRASDPSYDQLISHVSFHNSLSIVISSHYYIRKQRSLSIYTPALPVRSPRTLSNTRTSASLRELLSSDTAVPFSRSNRPLSSHTRSDLAIQ